MTSVNVTTTKNTVTVTEGDTRIVTITTAGPQGPAFADGDIGDIVISDGGTVATIDAGVINNAKVASDAAIAGSKLQASSGSNSGTMSAADFTKLAGVETGATADQTASEIKTLLNSDGLTNSQISGSAAIAGTKISPDFGSQNITSTGNISANAVSGASFSGNGASITNINAANIASGQIASARVPTLNQNTTGSAATLTTARTIAGVSFDGSANIDISYESLTNKLTVGDGGLTQNNFTNTLKTKLDGVATGATNVTNTNQLTNGAGFITASDGITGNAASATVLATARTIAGASFDGSANIDISYADLTNKLSVGDGGLTQNNFTNTLKTKLDGVEAGATADQTAAEILTLLSDQNIATTGTLGSGDITITGSQPALKFIDDGTNPDYNLYNNNGVLRLYDITNAADRLVVNTDGHIDVKGNLDCEAGLDVTGDLTVSGNMTVSGTTTTIDTTTLTVEDKNIELGKVSTPTDTTADGGGITLKGATDKTFQWLDATDSWTSSEHIALPDSKKLQLGDSQDLTIFHSGNDSKIQETGTGSLYIQTDNQIILGKTGGENLAKFIADGKTELYFDNSKKLETTSTGVNVTGNIVATGAVDAVAITIGGNTPSLSFTDANDDPDFRFLVNSNSFILEDTTNSANRLVVNSGGNVGIGETSPEAKLHVKIDDTGIAPHTSAQICLERAGTNYLQFLTANDGTSGLLFGDADDIDVSQIKYDHSGKKLYFITETGTALTIDEDQKVGIGTTSPTVTLDIESASPVIKLTDSDATGTPECEISGAGGDLILSADKDGEKDGSKIFFKIDGNTDVTIDHDGNVDIGGNVNIPNDSGKLQLGASQDLQLYHDGNNSFIREVGTGGLILSSGNIYLRNPSDVDMIFTQSGGQVELYYDNSKKLETTSTGAKVTGSLGIDTTPSAKLHIVESTSTPAVKIKSGTSSNQNVHIKLLNDNDSGELVFGVFGSAASTFGNITATDGVVSSNLSSLCLNAQNASGEIKFGIGATPNTKMLINSSGNLQIPNDTGKLQLGASQDLQIYHDGTHSHIREVGTGDLRLRSDKLQLMNENSEEFFVGTSNGAVELFYDDSKKFETTANGAKIESGTANFEVYSSTDDADATITIIGKTPSGGVGQAGRVEIVGESTGTSNGASSMHLRTRKTNNTVTTAITIDKDQDVTLPIDGQKLRLGASQDLQIYHDGSNSNLDNSTGYLKLRSNQFAVQNNAGDHDYITIPTNEQGVNLFYDNSKKLETKGYGIVVSGHVELDSGSGLFKAPDNAKLNLGNSNDLQIVHNGTDSNILGSTGILYIHNTGTNADDINLRAQDDIQLQVQNGETGINIKGNGAVEIYYDNSKKFETTSAGVTVTGKLIADNDGVQNTQGGTALSLRNATNTNMRANHFIVDDFPSGSGTYFIQATESGVTNDRNLCLQGYGGKVKIGANGTAPTELLDVAGNIAVSGNLNIPNDSGKLQLGASQDLQIYHDGTDTFFKVHTTGNVIHRARVNWQLQVNATDGGADDAIKALQNGAVEIYYDNSLKLQTTSSGVEVDGQLEIDGSVGETILKSSGAEIEFTRAASSNITCSNASGYLIINTGGSNERMRIDSSGKVMIGQTSASNSGKLYVSSSITGGGQGVITATDTSSNDFGCGLVVQKTTTTTSSSQRFIQFYSDTTSQPMGGIVGNGAEQAQFLQLSDERYKKNIQPLSGILEKINKLNVVSFDWKHVNESVKAGFIAQNVQTIFPEYVSENIANEGDETKLGTTGGMAGGYIAVLTAAIQELSAKVAALEAG